MKVNQTFKDLRMQAAPYFGTHLSSIRFLASVDAWCADKVQSLNVRFGL